MKSKLFKELLNRFYYKDKYKFYILFALSFVSGLFEYMGLFLIFNFILFLTSPSSIYCKKIIYLFNEYTKIEDFSVISLILGISVASIYIFKNIYMLLFTKINNSILEDLSIKATLKVAKSFIYNDYLLMNELSVSEKMAIFTKINIATWQFCLKYVHLFTNVILAIMLVLCLFIKFTTCAIIASIFLSVLSGIEYLYLRKKSAYQNENFSKRQEEMAKTNLKTITLTKEIKLNNIENAFIQKIETDCKNFASINRERNFNSVFHIYFTEISIMLAFICILIGLFVTTKFNNALLLSTISTMCIVILRLTPTINRIQSALYSINSNIAVVCDLIEFDKKYDNKINYNKTSEVMPFKNNIVFNDVSFKYANSTRGIEKYNFEIKKGDFIGIIGESGHYKTTLALILSALILCDNGTIKIDNEILTKENIGKWQNNIAFLSQDFAFIFDDIYQNIALKKNPNKKDIDNFILKNKIPFCIEKYKNKNIKDLSYGEKQRVALISVLYRNKSVIILDEATSSIDVISEDKISNILNILKGKKTIISIAHRLEALRHCDKIIFINKDNKMVFDTFKNLKENNVEFNNIIEISNRQLT